MRKYTTHKKHPRNLTNSSRIYKGLLKWLQESYMYIYNRGFWCALGTYFLTFHYKYHACILYQHLFTRVLKFTIYILLWNTMQYTTWDVLHKTHHMILNKRVTDVHKNTHKKTKWLITNKTHLLWFIFCVNFKKLGLVPTQIIPTYNKNYWYPGSSLTFQTDNFTPERLSISRTVHHTPAEISLTNSIQTWTRVLIISSSYHTS